MIKYFVVKVDKHHIGKTQWLKVVIYVKNKNHQIWTYLDRWTGFRMTTAICTVRFVFKLTPSSARAFCTILDVLRVIVRVITFLHFFPSFPLLFPESAGAPSNC